MIENEMKGSGEKRRGRELEKGEVKDRGVRTEGKRETEGRQWKQMCGKKFRWVEYNFYPIGLAFTPE